MIKCWIEAMRLRTLPVSVAGVLTGVGCALYYGEFDRIATTQCFLFALLAQITSNFANEYYDYKKGMDRKGRKGFRRGVTEGDISPDAMKRATYITLGLAAMVGLSMLMYAPWWIVPAGVLIGLGTLAYSAGPYPLSHHGLGDVAVVLFFGVVPVMLTCYLQMGSWNAIEMSIPSSLAVGLLAANVLVVNNYRDMDDDKAVNKKTTVVIFGRKTMGRVYCISGIVAMLVMIPVWTKLHLAFWLVPIVYLYMHIMLWKKMLSSIGSQLNPILGQTARNLLLFSIMLFVAFVWNAL